MNLIDEKLVELQDKAIARAVEEYTFSAPPMPKLSYTEQLLWCEASKAKWAGIKAVAELAIAHFYRLLLAAEQKRESEVDQ